VFYLAVFLVNQWLTLIFRKNFVHILIRIPRFNFKCFRSQRDLVNLHIIFKFHRYIPSEPLNNVFADAKHKVARVLLDKLFVQIVENIWRLVKYVISRINDFDI